MAKKAPEYPKHAATLAWAISKIGEQEQPMGKNKGLFVQFCQRHTWLRGTGWAWCRAFTLTAIEEGGKFHYPDGSAGAWDGFARAKARGWTLAPSQWKLAIPGDECTWKFGSGHSSIFEKCDGKTVTSIDGNWGDEVQRVEHPLSDLLGFNNWPEKPVDPVAHETAPLFQVVGSVSGKRKIVFRGPRSAVGKWIEKTAIGKLFPAGVSIRRMAPKS